MATYFLRPLTKAVLKVAGILGAVVAATACKPADTMTSDLHSDSSTTQPAYDSIVDKMNELARQSKLVQVLSYGKTVSGKDLYMMRIGKPAAGAPDKPLVVFSEATHGNEFLGVALGLAEGIVTGSDSGTLKNFFQDKLGVMLFVPVVNVDGYEYHRNLSPEKRGGKDGSLDAGNSRGRRNKNDVDLNRDFPIAAVNFAGFTQLESKAYADAVANQLGGGYKLVTTIDYHCCIGEGSLTYPLQYSTTARLPAEDLKRHRDVGAIMKRELPTISVANGAEAMGYPAIGMSHDYFYEKYGSTSFTYEGADGVDVRRVDQHVRAWIGILEAAANSAPNQDPSSSTSTST